MIDYDKLKIVCDLCLKSGYSFSYFFGGKDETKYFGKDKIDDGFTLYDLCSGPIIDDYDNIEGLISKLKELIELDEPRLEPKYKIGQEVWILSGVSSFTKYTIKKIYWCDNLKDYRLELTEGYGGANVGQDDVYPSKDKLVKAQIIYWIEQLETKSSKSLADLDMLDHIGADTR